MVDLLQASEQPIISAMFLGNITKTGSLEPWSPEKTKKEGMRTRGRKEMMAKVRQHAQGQRSMVERT